ncbi:MAG: hypothetical protein Q9183_005703 [Haloplaca sp. 2 TL-2023]
MKTTDHLLAVHRESSPLGTKSPTTGLFTEWGPEYVEIPDDELYFRENKHDFSGNKNKDLVEGNEDAGIGDELDLLSWVAVDESDGEEVVVNQHEVNHEGSGGDRVNRGTVNPIVKNKQIDDGNSGLEDEMEGVLEWNQGETIGDGKMEGVVECKGQKREGVDGKRDGASQWSEFMESRGRDQESML